MTTSTFPSAGPEEEPPDDDLHLVQVVPASLSDPDAVRRGVVRLRFNRTLSWWEREAAIAHHGISYDDDHRSYVVRHDLLDPDILNWAGNLGRRIETEARTERRIVAGRVDTLNQEAERINGFLKRAAPQH